jgi:gluconolactonase
VQVVEVRAEVAESLYETFDPRFAPCRRGDSRLEVVHAGNRWAEGPLYVPAGRYLLWSDIPNDRLMRWDETTGQVGVFRQPAGYPNGNTLDNQGRLVTCEQGNRRVTRTEHDGSVTVLATHWRGKRLNSPNDATVRSDGLIWFSDPDYGITSDYEGHRAESEIGACSVYRLDPDGGEVTLAAEGFVGPNGLSFSADETLLYVSDSGANDLKVLHVDENGWVTDQRVLVTAAQGQFDNLRLDDDGRIWVGAGDQGVHCYAPDGTLLGRIKVPEVVANITFGGPRRNVLFIAADTTVYSLVLSVTGRRQAFTTGR